MATYGEKSKRLQKSDKFDIPPSLQETLSIAQREQAKAVSEFFKSWRQARQQRNRQKRSTRAAFRVR